MTTSTIRKTARISSCGTYRYRLTRYWGPGPMLPFVMLNPSVADAEVDDPTIRRCMGFARREGAGGIVVCNLYAYRATKPEDMKRASNPVGPDNDDRLIEVAVEAVANQVPIICAWGTNGDPERHRIVVKIMRDTSASLVCLGKTANGSPRHPLYVRADQPLEAFP